MDEIRRVDYESGALLESDLAATPLDQFRLWMDQAVAAGIEEPNAMSLATVDSQGRPSVRTVLCKEVNPQGFVFFTNYESQKAAQIEHNPQVGLCFHWQPLHRQVRVCGRAVRLPAIESDEYFASRPRGAQLGAWASPQSSVIPDRQYLTDHLEQVEQRFTDDVPRPDHWGGFVVLPSEIEFWQGQRSRLHDRLRLTRRNDGLLDDPADWTVERLAP